MSYFVSIIISDKCSKPKKKTHSIRKFIHAIVCRCVARVKVPVCNVKSELKLSDNEGESMTEHIVGTRMSDLTQIYNGKVRIKGSVNVQNIYAKRDPTQFAENPTGVCQVLVNGADFDLLNISQQYWMKSINQVLCAILFYLFFFIAFIGSDA